MARFITYWSQEDPENRLWLASRMYVTGEIDIKKLKEIESAYIENYNNVVFVIRKCKLLYNSLDRMRKILKPRIGYGGNLPSGHPHV